MFIINNLNYNSKKTDCMNKTKLYSVGNYHLFINILEGITM
jgi:hypothetical protein